MRVPERAEMTALRKIYEPYYKDYELVPDAPKEAIEAREKYKVLFAENYDYWEKFWQSE